MLATLASQIPILAPALPPLGSGFFDLTPFDQKTGHSSLRVYQDPQKLIFSLIAHTKQILLVTFCDTTAGVGASFRTHGRTDGRRTEEGQTDVEVEVVI